MKARRKGIKKERQMKMKGQKNERFVSVLYAWRHIEMHEQFSIVFLALFNDALAASLVILIVGECILLRMFHE
jgi:hypothetical protein